MKGSGSPSRVLPPKLTPAETKGLRDYWRVYEDRRDEVTAQLLRMARRHPEFKFILRNAPARPSADQGGEANELQRQAIFDGNWKPYLKSLQLQGMQYAQSGLSFRAWFEIVGAFRKYMMPHLLEAYGKSPRRLLAAIDGVDILIDLAMSIIGASYLETKEQLILRQRETIQGGQVQLASIINSAMDAIISIDENQHILIFNPAAERMFLRFADKVIGKSLTMLIPERLRSKHEADVSAFGATSITKRSMGRLGMVYGLRSNGQEFPLEVSISQIQTGGKKTFTAILRDITERERAEQALHDAELKYRTLVEQIPNAITYIDSVEPSTATLYISPQIEAILGYAPDEWTRMPNSWSSRLHPDDREKMVAENSRHRLTGEPFRQEYRLLARDGHDVWIRDEAAIVRDRTGRSRYSHGIMIDITELKQAETALQNAHDKLELQVQERTAALSRSNALLQMMLDYVPDHVYFKDLQSRFIRNSRSQARAMGLSDPAEVVGKSDFDFFRHAQKSYEEEQEMIRSGEPLVDFEEQVIWPDGRESWVSTTKTPLRDQAGRISGIFGISRDITDRKRAERELEQAKTGLEAANKELEAFAYSVSHDLRAPLRSIDGFSQALLEDYAGQLPAEGQGYLQRVRAAAQRMALLIDDLLDLSRVARSPLRPQAVNLSELAGRILAELQREQPERRVNISVMPDVTADCDSHLMGILLENLLSNAWKFTSRRGEARIEFGMLDGGDSRTFFVRDNGAGFDMTYANKLFGAFQRLHTTDEFPGTGVGLATVQRIIHRHGGRVWAEAAVNEGATFYFTLP
jgi:PAS domain S-box-containing protein